MPVPAIRFLILFAAGCLCALGCKRQYSNYCPGALNDNCLNVDAPVEHCTTDQACAPEVCDLAGTKTCVQCTTANPAACTGMAPVCGSDDKCRACATHAECTTNACLPDGSCGTDSTVAYVDPTSSGTTCTQAAPCKRIADAVQTGRPFVKIHGVLHEQVMLNGATVTLLADPGATLTDTANGILIRIDGMSRIAIYDLTITGASGMNNPGISLQPGNMSTVSLTRTTVSNNAGGGIIASGGTLTLSQSTLSGNSGSGISTSGGTLVLSQSLLLNNTGGGVSVMNGVFTVAGNAFFGNGGVGSLIGGISIGTTANAANRLEFNTFALNTARDTIGSGIHCLADAFTAKDNIVNDNRNATATTQLGGTCAHAYSIVHPGVLPTGTTNLGDDPLFANEATGDLHLQSASGARGKADPAADLTGISARDIDGIARVSPADIGAYQFHASGAGSSAANGAEGEQR